LNMRFKIGLLEGWLMCCLTAHRAICIPTRNGAPCRE
jgi:hypothetical protein